MTNNTNLHKAKREKNDEFYTRYEDIEKEMIHYIPHFKDKVIYCNCDSEKSNFYKFFKDHFDEYRLKKIIFTYYDTSQPVFVIIKTCSGESRTSLTGNGDFRSLECIEFLKQSDIVITNPPFSLFREYILQLEKYSKKYIILGNQNSLTHKDIFPLIMSNELWLGVKGIGEMWFKVPYNTEPRKFRYKESNGEKWISMGNICWYTNLDHAKRHNYISLNMQYYSEKYHKYDNYNAINVNKITEIPTDYYGVMGVPVTFLSKYNSEQFKIVGTIGAGGWFNGGKATVSGKDKYKRILIRKKKQ